MVVVWISLFMRQPFVYADHLDNTMRILTLIVAIVICNFQPVNTMHDCKDEASITSIAIRNQPHCSEWLKWYCS